MSIVPIFVDRWLASTADGKHHSTGDSGSNCWPAARAWQSIKRANCWQAGTGAAARARGCLALAFDVSTTSLGTCLRGSER